MYSYNAQLIHHISEPCTCILGELDIHGGPCSNLVSSPHQWTPLHYAAIQGKEDTVQLLIEKGADINVKDRYEVHE